MKNVKYMNIEHKKVYKATDWAIAMAMDKRCVWSTEKRKTYDS